MSQKHNHIKVFETAPELAQGAAEVMLSIAKQSIEARGRFVIALSGGTTPDALFSLLAKPPFRDEMPWNKIFIFWGDERCVPFDDKKNNAFRAKTIVLDQVAIPLENIYPIPVGIDPALSAKKYESTINHFFGTEALSFDLIFLGLGENGHTASLFPESAIIHEKTQLLREVYVPEQHMFRITMTPLLINQAHTIIFLVEGENKAAILNTVLNGSLQPDKYPAQIITAEKGKLYWFIDKKAAALLSS